MTLRVLLMVAAPPVAILALLANWMFVPSVYPASPVLISVQPQDVDSALKAFAVAWRSQDYESARAAIPSVPDALLRTEMEQLVLFGQVRAALRRNDLLSTSHLVRQLKPGPKRALTEICLAARHRNAASQRHWLRAGLNDASDLPDNQYRALLPLILPVVLEVDSTLGLRTLDRALHGLGNRHAGTQPGTDNKDEPGVRYIATGSHLLELLPGRGHRQVFVLSLPGMVRTDLRDLALAQHSRLRCAYSSRRESTHAVRAVDRHGVSTGGSD